MTIKDELHHLVDQLDEDAAGELLEYAQWLAAEEDEPLADEERSRVEAGEAEIARGEYVRLEDLRHQFGQRGSRSVLPSRPHAISSGCRATCSGASSRVSTRSLRVRSARTPSRSRGLAVGRRSARVGAWRIVFPVDQDKRRVDVSAVGPRGQVYRR